MQTKDCDSTNSIECLINENANWKGTLAVGMDVNGNVMYVGFLLASACAMTKRNCRKMELRHCHSMRIGCASFGWKMKKEIHWKGIQIDWINADSITSHTDTLSHTCSVHRLTFGVQLFANGMRLFSLLSRYPISIENEQQLGSVTTTHTKKKSHTLHPARTNGPKWDGELHLNSVEKLAQHTGAHFKWCELNWCAFHMVEMWKKKW